MPPEDHWDTSGHGKVEPAEETGQYGVEVDKKAVLEAVFRVGIAGLRKFSLAARQTEGIYDNDSNDKMPELVR